MCLRGVFWRWMAINRAQVAAIERGLCGSCHSVGGTWTAARVKNARGCLDLSRQHRQRPYFSGGLQ